MSWLRLILATYAVGAWLGLNARPAFAETNTNQCIRDLGGLTACQDRNALGLPNDLQACCDGVRQLSEDSCHCNPAVDTILGEEGKKIYDLEAICRIAQPKKWDHLTPFFLRKCDAVKTHDYGCEKTDIEIDGARIQDIFKFQEAFENSKDPNICFDTPAFTKHLSTVFTPDINFTVPYGIGTYTGTQNVAEYLGMAFVSLTHGFWLNDTTPDPTKKARLDVSPDGTVWTLGSTAKGDFFRGRLPYTDQYLEQAVQFQGCNTLISNYTVQPTEGLKFVIEKIVQTADRSKRWGIEDICRYHTKFCAGDPETKQYESEQECIDYIRSLPLHSAACGPNRPLSGSSLSCKYKHHFMIPANPKMHCAHIGKKGTIDIDNHLKCDDAAECSTDQGQDSWPAVQNTGEETPEDVVKLFDELNEDYQSEPMGCAIPSEDQGHHHE